MKSLPGIYQIRNLVNGNLYIGQTSNLSAREDNHFTNLKYNKHHTPHLQAAYNKYGKDNFIFEPLVYCEITELDRLEQAIIDKLSPKYNSLKIIGVGTRGYKFTDEQRAKMSAAQRGRIFSDETRKKMSEVRLAKHIKLTEEQKAKMKLFQRGHKINAGRKLSDECKRKIGEASKKRIRKRNNLHKYVEDK